MRIYSDDVEHGTNKYVSYYKGDKGSNIIITVPHGGDQLPQEIIDRDIVLRNNQHLSKTLNITTEPDFFTAELAEALRRQIHLLTNRKPHVIVSNLDRKKVDLNRELFEATLNNKDALIAFNEFHGFIEKAKNSIKPRGILFDIHGQSHPEKWVELGYCMDLEVKEDISAQNSSISTLASETNAEFEKLLYGTTSLGYFLQESNIKAIPSPDHKLPLGRNYYWGGYNTKTHGSKCGGHIDAIQIESPVELRRPENLNKYAENLAEAIISFVNVHYKC